MVYNIKKSGFHRKYHHIDDLPTNFLDINLIDVVEKYKEIEKGKFKNRRFCNNKEYVNKKKEHRCIIKIKKVKTQLITI